MGFSLSLSELGKDIFKFSSGDWAKQANGSVITSLGDTVVLSTVCISKEPSEVSGFLPLTVEYQEKTYAMGKIPGGFIKREGRPKDSEILCARLVDRPLRPLFPKGLTNEVQIIVMVLSSDGKNDPACLGINGASCALFISDIPFYTPVGAVRVSKLERGLVVNPTYEERENSLMDLVVVGTEEKIVMLEGTFKEVEEKDILEAIKFAHPFIRKIISLQIQLREKIGKEKKEFPLWQIDKQLLEAVKARTINQLDEVYGLVNREEREKVLDKILSSLCQELVNPEDEIDEEKIKDLLRRI
jgi:polyribonucleotide nucleotidyltransferase